eukprot:Lithocolla_globosa_v1_NODE_165_length_5553_cov_13.632479.p8 type:complete len:112 gc:universal NODE_165_length_5553_cov_13.632479:4147-3812(-)
MVETPLEKGRVPFRRVFYREKMFWILHPKDFTTLIAFFKRFRSSGSKRARRSSVISSTEWVVILSVLASCSFISGVILTIELATALRLGALTDLGSSGSTSISSITGVGVG